MKNINNLKNGKSSGEDKITNEMIKAGKSAMIQIYVKLFNTIFDNCKYPKIWNKAYIVPLYKSGDPALVNNYRGISITSCLGKLYNSVILNRLQMYATSKNTPQPYQTGFMKGHSTLNNIFVLKSLINKFMRDKKKTVHMLCRFLQSI